VVKKGVLMAGELRCGGKIPMLEAGRRGVAGVSRKRRRRRRDWPAWDGDEGADRWGPHVSEGRERRCQGRKAQPEEENTFSRICQRCALTR
jgi:hypothetical protein